jgi:hypothetical protein
MKVKVWLWVQWSVLQVLHTWVLHQAFIQRSLTRELLDLLDVLDDEVLFWLLGWNYHGGFGLGMKDLMSLRRCFIINWAFFDEIINWKEILVLLLFKKDFHLIDVLACFLSEMGFLIFSWYVFCFDNRVLMFVLLSQDLSELLKDWGFKCFGLCFILDESLLCRFNPIRWCGSIHISNIRLFSLLFLL